MKNVAFFIFILYQLFFTIAFAQQRKNTSWPWCDNGSFKDKTIYSIEVDNRYDFKIVRAEDSILFYNLLTEQQLVTAIENPLAQNALVFFESQYFTNRHCGSHFYMQTKVKIYQYLNEERKCIFPVDEIAESNSFKNLLDQIEQHIPQPPQYTVKRLDINNTKVPDILIESISIHENKLRIKIRNNTGKTFETKNWEKYFKLQLVKPNDFMATQMLYNSSLPFQFDGENVYFDTLKPNESKTFIFKRPPSYFENLTGSYRFEIIQYNCKSQKSSSDNPFGSLRCDKAYYLSDVFQLDLTKK